MSVGGSSTHRSLRFFQVLIVAPQIPVVVIESGEQIMQLHGIVTLKGAYHAPG